MCGITPPSEGRVTIQGIDMGTQKHEGRRYIGYCPQFDCLWPKLTVYETLKIYASLRGYEGAELERVLDEQIIGLQLAEYRDKWCGTLSGGNKRKVSVAIALIGMPPVVFLDEPSTGMDPVARRFMWTVIQDLADSQKDVVVVLTTHSMDEASALCERIAIQVDGSFRCLGTSQQIKDLHGSGYEVHIKFAPPADAQHQDDLIQQNVDQFEEFFKNYTSQTEDNAAAQQMPKPEVTGLSATFIVNVSTSNVGNLMRELERKCTADLVSDWSVSQVTLERVFNKFAMQSENSGVTQES